MKMWHIYALKDPRSNAIRYVGWAFDVKRRIYNHKHGSRQGRTHRDNWLRLLASLGLRPTWEILESGTGDWAAAERAWISRLRSENCPLTNLTDGGDGAPGYHKKHSDETRAKISAAHSTPEARIAKSAAVRGRKLTPEHRAKLAECGRNATLEVRMKRAAALRGRSRPPEVAAKLSAANIGKKMRPDVVAKVAEKLRGRKQSPESIAKRASALRGKKRLGQALENIRAAAERRDYAATAAKNRGAKRSEETRARLRAAWVRRRGGEVAA